jgi:hypothetical protein
MIRRTEVIGSPTEDVNRSPRRLLEQNDESAVQRGRYIVTDWHYFAQPQIQHRVISKTCD